jgi:hypothetical protein
MMAVLLDISNSLFDLLVYFLSDYPQSQFFINSSGIGRISMMKKRISLSFQMLFSFYFFSFLDQLISPFLSFTLFSVPSCCRCIPYPSSEQESFLNNTRDCAEHQQSMKSERRWKILVILQ